MASDGTEQGKLSYPSLGLGNSFAFKFEDLKGRVHRVNCGEWSRTGSLLELEISIPHPSILIQVSFLKKRKEKKIHVLRITLSALTIQTFCMLQNYICVISLMRRAQISK